MSIGFATNADSGGAVYVSGARAGLFSTTQNYLIPAYSGNLAGQSQGFGVQASGPTQTSGGPLADVSPFNGSGNSVGAESTTPNQILTTTAPIVGGSASANVQAKSASTTPATADYTETLTFIATGNF
jgi:hypothetical protein